MYEVNEILEIVQQRKDAAKKIFEKGLQPLTDKVFNLEVTGTILLLYS
jgi:hypothetical protein